MGLPGTPGGRLARPAQMAPEGRFVGAADLVKNSEASNKLVKMTN